MTKMCRACAKRMYHPRSWSTKVTEKITMKATMRMCSRCGPRMTRHLTISMFGRSGSLHVREAFVTDEFWRQKNEESVRDMRNESITVN